MQSHLHLSTTLDASPRASAESAVPPIPRHPGHPGHPLGIAGDLAVSGHPPTPLEGSRMGRSRCLQNQNPDTATHASPPLEGSRIVMRVPPRCAARAPPLPPPRRAAASYGWKKLASSRRRRWSSFRSCTSLNQAWSPVGRKLWGSSCMRLCRIKHSKQLILGQHPPTNQWGST